jgi:hypothetical protein
MHRPLAAAWALIFVFGIGMDSAAPAPITTCSAMRDRCLRVTAGRSLRSVAGSPCHSTYESCMKTGVWDATAYPYGERRTGLQQR